METLENKLIFFKLEWFLCLKNLIDIQKNFTK